MNRVKIEVHILRRNQLSQMILIKFQ